MNVTLRRLLAGARRPASARRDDGFTLVEGLVAMVIFGVSMSVVTSVVLAMTANMRQAQGVSIATDQTRLAFSRFDKQVRYATDIRPPGPGSTGGWYVELALQDPKRNPSTAATNKKQMLCYQWRLKDRTLQTRNWPQPTSPTATVPAGTISDWNTVATGVINDLGFVGSPSPPEPPFIFPPTITGATYSGLTIDLRTRRSEKPQGQAQLKSTFYARNTDTSPSTLAASHCNTGPRP